MVSHSGSLGQNLHAANRLTDQCRVQGGYTSAAVVLPAGLYLVWPFLASFQTVTHSAFINPPVRQIPSAGDEFKVLTASVVLSAQRHVLSKLGSNRPCFLRPVSVTTRRDAVGHPCCIHWAFFIQAQLYSSGEHACVRTTCYILYVLSSHERCYLCIMIKGLLLTQ